MKFEIKKKLFSRSERVKCVELHPEMPWVLISLYSGNITIIDYSTQATIKTIENSMSPVRVAKFCVRKQWIVAGSDDLKIRVYNYNTAEKIKTFDAHNDYIRYLVIHPSQPIIITSSDDGVMKLWDFDKNFTLVRTLDEHVHYVMMMAFNPRDLNTFCSASLDKTLKIWSLNSTTTKANITLAGHEQGVNCVDYYRGDKPHIISGSDDRLVKIWDYQNKQCIHTLDQHQHNISYVCFHPELPIILTSCEDGIIRLFHSQTFKLENQLSYGLERAWTIDIGKDNTNIIAMGFDEGTVVIKIGNDEPVISMNNGKLIWAKNHEVITSNLKAININDESIKDGDIIKISPKELGHCDFYSLGLKHSPNGHMFAIYNDSEYAIYKSQNFKGQNFGSGTDVIWSPQNDFAIRDNFSIKIFKSNGNQHCEIKTDYLIDGLYGGPLICAKSQEFLIFYDWESAKTIRRIDISAKKVYWNDAGNLVAVTTVDDFYVLLYQEQIVKELAETQQNPDGYEQAFDIQYEIHESIQSGLWIENLFFFTLHNGKINYSLMGKTFNFSNTDRKKYLIGYLNTQNRIYLTDKFFNIQQFEYPLALAQYQSLIAQNCQQKANQLLETIPEKYYDKIAKFLDAIDKKSEAFKIVQDREHKFELALSLNIINEAFQIAKEGNNASQYKQVGDLALLDGNILLAIECFKFCDDLGSLLLIYSSLGLKNELRELAQTAKSLTRMNIAFNCFFLISDLENCYQVLIDSKRLPEAAMFSKTYLPSKVAETVKIWKSDLEKNNFLLTAQKIADPMDYLNDDSFSDLALLLKLESANNEFRNNVDVPAHHYEQLQFHVNQDLFKEIKENPELDLSQFNKIEIDIQQENPVIEIELQKLKKNSQDLM